MILWYRLLYWANLTVYSFVWLMEFMDIPHEWEFITFLLNSDAWYNNHEVYYVCQINLNLSFFVRFHNFRQFQLQTYKLAVNCFLFKGVFNFTFYCLERLEVRLLGVLSPLTSSIWTPTSRKHVQSGRMKPPHCLVYPAIIFCAACDVMPWSIDNKGHGRKLCTARSLGVVHGQKNNEV